MAQHHRTTVLITGCSDGGLGSALALALHATNRFRVFATGRNLSKLGNVRSAGIEVLALDVLSEQSISSCVSEVLALTPALDMLVNNAGAAYFGALTDVSLTSARGLFELNVFSCLSMIQAFMPLLLRSTRPGGAVIVNHTSVASVVFTPFVGLYGATKAALAMLSATMRSELRPFGVRVVDLKSGSVKSNVSENSASGADGVPEKSLYYAARGWLNALFTGKLFDDQAIDSAVWAAKVVRELEKKTPPNEIWVGGFVNLVWFAVNFFPKSMAEKLARDTVGMEKVEKSIAEYGRDKAAEDAYGKL
ncbi:hypothetical protein PV08_00609 [Exophiala spinifera]|uniref:NADPH-dependent 1-acyldihydroxyacetone phosphate reductase n=1 Tax=Exophiala spinifera TaxID=91928 RepID=A0A0D2C927_9EURO|nr:uncharacterized protein PV08_00609 [Exophiala spinifera]KIW20034.1 hypothetical protein PV08_00609 [Exophiala spinifera]